MYTVIIKVMLPSKESLEEDRLIVSEYEGCDDDQAKIPQKKSGYSSLILSAALFCVALAFAYGVLFSTVLRHDPKGYAACAKPEYRQEWRALSEEQKQDYISAVLCLKVTPSRLGMNQSLWEDFAWVHAMVGGYCA